MEPNLKLLKKRKKLKVLKQIAEFPIMQQTKGLNNVDYDTEWIIK